MNLVTKSFVSLAVLIVGIGCGGYPSGSLYDSTTVPHGVDRQELSGPGKAGEKGGETCATGILGIVSFGDASVDAAKKEAKVTEQSSVEFRHFSILGIYTQGCTEVHGK